MSLRLIRNKLRLFLGASLVLCIVFTPHVSTVYMSGHNWIFVSICVVEIDILVVCLIYDAFVKYFMIVSIIIIHAV